MKKQNNILPINNKLFESLQKYHDTFKNYSKPYDTDYYNVYLIKYLESNDNPTELVLVNFFTKLYSWTYGIKSNIETALRFTKYFKNTFISKELLNKIFSNIYGPPDWETNKIELGYSNINVIIILMCVMDDLLKNLNHDIKVEDLYSQCKKILWKNLLNSTSSYDKDNVKLLVDVMKKIFTQLYNLDADQIISVDGLEFLFENNFLTDYVPKNIVEYRLMYKHVTSVKKLKSFKNFKPDIYCLENACVIKSNTRVISSLMKTIKPDSNCLSNAIKYTDNYRVVELLLNEVDPTIEQIVLYGKILRNPTLDILLEKI